MTQKQLAILNSLVTFAAENIPGGLKDDEREVANIVGKAVVLGEGDPLYEYKTVNVSLHGSVENAANDWSHGGWRVVAAIGARDSSYADQLIIERLRETPCSD